RSGVSPGAPHARAPSSTGEPSPFPRRAVVRMARRPRAPRPGGAAARGGERRVGQGALGAPPGGRPPRGPRGLSLEARLRPLGGGGGAGGGGRRSGRGTGGALSANGPPARAGGPRAARPRCAGGHDAVLLGLGPALRRGGDVPRPPGGPRLGCRSSLAR